MATNDSLAKNGEQQNIVGEKIRAQSAIIRSATSTEAQKEAAFIERDKLRLQNKALGAEEAVLTKQDPATSLYTGVDQNSGQQRYYNPATGNYYLSEIPPTSEQQANVRSPARGFISQTTENLVSPPAVATAQVPVRLDPPDPVTQEPSTVQTTATPPITQRQVAIDKAQNISTMQDPALRQQAAVTAKAEAEANDEAIRNAGELGNQQGLTKAKLNTQSQATQQDAVNKRRLAGKIKFKSWCKIFV